VVSAFRLLVGAAPWWWGVEGAEVPWYCREQVEGDWGGRDGEAQARWQESFREEGEVEDPVESRSR